MSRIRLAVLVFLLLVARQGAARAACTGNCVNEWSNGQDSSASTMTVAIAPAGGTNHSLIAMVASLASSTPPVPTDAHNTWTPIGTNCSNAGAGMSMTYYYTDSVFAGSYNVTITRTGGFLLADIIEVKNAASTPSFDLAGACNTAGAGGLSPQSGLITTTNASDLVDCGIGGYQNAGTTGSFATLSCPSCTTTPNTLTALTAQAVGTDDLLLGPAYLFSSAAGNVTQQWTVSGSATLFGSVGMCAAFKQQAAATPTPTPTPGATPTPNQTATPTPTPTPSMQGFMFHTGKADPDGFRSVRTASDTRGSDRPGRLGTRGADDLRLQAVAVAKTAAGYDRGNPQAQKVDAENRQGIRRRRRRGG